ncbi:MAG: hypothetical protein KME03_05965 [Aphanocapsa lilacina HA4352-LM1]|jgi:hypothetical protein|nr:hypothetical protein [Aphanocapsa lilacina HA4352-LM1]
MESSSSNSVITVIPAAIASFTAVGIWWLNVRQKRPGPLAENPSIKIVYSRRETIKDFAHCPDLQQSKTISVVTGFFLLILSVVFAVIYGFASGDSLIFAYTMLFFSMLLLLYGGTNLLFGLNLNNTDEAKASLLIEGSSADVAKQCQRVLTAMEGRDIGSSNAFLRFRLNVNSFSPGQVFEATVTSRGKNCLLEVRSVYYASFQGKAENWGRLDSENISTFVYLLGASIGEKFSDETESKTLISEGFEASNSLPTD